jgi:hypothetical protein
MVSFTSRPLYPQGKSPWYPLDRRLGGPQNRPRRESNPIIVVVVVVVVVIIIIIIIIIMYKGYISMPGLSVLGIAQHIMPTVYT